MSFGVGTYGRGRVRGLFWTCHFIHTTKRERSTIMGKYFLGWLLGVPAIVLVLLYLVFH